VKRDASFLPANGWDTLKVVRGHRRVSSAAAGLVCACNAVSGVSDFTYGLGPTATTDGSGATGGGPAASGSAGGPSGVGGEAGAPVAAGGAGGSGGDGGGGAGCSGETTCYTPSGAGKAACNPTAPKKAPPCAPSDAFDYCSCGDTALFLHPPKAEGAPDLAVVVAPPTGDTLYMLELASASCCLPTCFGGPCPSCACPDGRHVVLFDKNNGGCGKLGTSVKHRVLRDDDKMPSPGLCTDGDVAILTVTP
jgi:hypothetical protein